MNRYVSGSLILEPSTGQWQLKTVTLLSRLFNPADARRVDKEQLQSSPMARGSGSTDRNRPGASDPHGDDTMAFIVFSTPCTSIGSIVHCALCIVHCN